MNIFAAIAEERIQKDIEDGGFKALAGKGQPLRFEDDSMVPEDLRMAYKVLRNAGFTPPEIADRKELVSIMDMLEKAPQELQTYRQVRKLEVLVRRMQSRAGHPILLEEHDEYYRKAVKRITVKNLAP